MALKSIIITLTFRSICWPWKWGQRSDVSWYVKSSCAPFYMLMIHSTLVPILVSKFEAFSQFPSINHEVDLEDLGGCEPDLNRLLTWARSTPLQSLIRVHSQLFELSCSHTERHAHTRYQKHKLCFQGELKLQVSHQTLTGKTPITARTHILNITERIIRDQLL